MGKVIPFRTSGAEPPVDPNWTLEAGLRSYIAVEAAFTPWSDSTLIAGLVTASPAERAEIVRELEERVR